MQAPEFDVASTLLTTPFALLPITRYSSTGQPVQGDARALKANNLLLLAHVPQHIGRLDT